MFVHSFNLSSQLPRPVSSSANLISAQRCGYETLNQSSGFRSLRPRNFAAPQAAPCPSRTRGAFWRPAPLPTLHSSACKLSLVQPRDCEHRVHMANRAARWGIVGVSRDLAGSSFCPPNVGSLAGRRRGGFHSPAGLCARRGRAASGNKFGPLATSWTAYGAVRPGGTAVALHKRQVHRLNQWLYVHLAVEWPIPSNHHLIDDDSPIRR